MAKGLMQKSASRKLEWYLGNDPRTGRERRRPLDGSLLGNEGLGLAVRFIQWIGTNMKNYNYKGKAKELTISILEAVHSALQNRYSDQQMMKEGRSRSDAVKLIADPLTYDCRMVFTVDLMVPRALRSIGPCPAFIVSAVTRGRKTMENGKVGYMGFLRHSNPLICAQGRLAAYFCHRYNLEAAIIPDPNDPEAWNNWALWPATSSSANVTYEQLADRLRKYYKANAINVSKLLHGFRVLGACTLDDAGVPDETIARMGRWLRQAMYKSYLKFFRAEGLLAAGGWSIEKPHGFFYDASYRFCTTLSESVVLLLEYLGIVLVQDSLVLAEQFPDDPIHELLSTSPTFVDLEDEFIGSLTTLIQQGPLTTITRSEPSASVAQETAEHEAAFQRIVAEADACRASGASADDQEGLAQGDAEDAGPTAPSPSSNDRGPARDAAEAVSEAQTLEMQSRPAAAPEAATGIAWESRPAVGPQEGQGEDQALPCDSAAIGLERQQPPANTTLWRLYDLGEPHINRPALRELEAENGSEWRSRDSNDRKRWSEISIFATEVIRRAEESHTTPVAIIQQMDLERLSHKPRAKPVPAFLKEVNKRVAARRTA
ncbi:hypothetical protein WJX84_000649 [Apatococcus fuscideae]|uniref:Ndc10 domain-containing protein n=1 Tax=Apatococcus fuscideae TaxID=2026836 RepID=A0AAW1TMT1_9CHLO